MDCMQARDLVFRSLDGELNLHEESFLNTHLASCPSCAREMKLVSIPRKIARVLPVLEPSPYFYQRLRARLESESETVTLWQILLGLSRPIVPVLATVTLVLISLFAYYQARGPEADVYRAYDMIFMRSDRPTRMVIADQGEITEESVLQAMAEVEPPPTEGGEARQK